MFIGARPWKKPAREDQESDVKSKNSRILLSLWRFFLTTYLYP
jgi:hypothetical protein